jgi:hypothetical protein
MKSSPLPNSYAPYISEIIRLGSPINHYAQGPMRECFPIYFSFFESIMQPFSVFSLR